MIDNLESTTNAISKFILENAPGELSAYDRMRLENKDHYQNLTFKKPYAGDYLEANLSVELARASYERSTDDQGNDWQQYKLKVGVSWSSYGTSNVELAMARLAFFQTVADFAWTIEKTFTDEIFSLRQTAEEKASRQAEFAVQKNKNYLKEIVRANCKSMRVGKTCHVGLNASGDVPAGIYNVELANKSYDVVVSDESGLYFTRLT